MGINLHVLLEELAGMGLSGEPSSSPLERNLRRTLPWQAWSGSRGCVVVASRDELPASVPDALPEALVAIGELPEGWRGTEVDALVAPAGTESAELVAAIDAVLDDYGAWEASLTELLVEGAPLHAYAAATRRMTANPLFLTNEAFRMLFYDDLALREESFEASRRYRAIMQVDRAGDLESAYASLEQIRELVSNPSTREVFASSEPTIYRDPSYDYETLTYNLGEPGRRLGCLCMDGFLHPITTRDHFLIKVLGDTLSRAMRLRGVAALGRSGDIAEVLEGLLAHRLVDDRRIESAVDRLGWEEGDLMACLAVESRAYGEGSSLSESVAPELGMRIPTDCYAVFEGRAVFVANLTRAGMGMDELFAGIGRFLEDNLLAAGISRVFTDLKDLFWFYRQCLDALRLTDEGPIARFEDVSLRRALEILRGDGPTDALVPEGLRRLLRYDETHHGELASTLRAYLDSNMSVTETCRTAFIARNTCIYRVKRIREVSGLDLDDPDVHFGLSLAFRVLGQG